MNRKCKAAVVAAAVTVIMGGAVIGAGPAEATAASTGKQNSPERSAGPPCNAMEPNSPPCLGNHGECDDPLHRYDESDSCVGILHKDQR